MLSTLSSQQPSKIVRFQLWKLLHHVPPTHYSFCQGSPCSGCLHDSLLLPGTWSIYNIPHPSSSLSDGCLVCCFFSALCRRVLLNWCHIEFSLSFKINILWVGGVKVEGSVKKKKMSNGKKMCFRKVWTNTFSNCVLSVFRLSSRDFPLLSIYAHSKVMVVLAESKCYGPFCYWQILARMLKISVPPE